MPGSVNRVILVGNLGKDVEVGYTPAGMAAATLSIATNERWKDKAGKPQERTEWHRVQIWGDTAINASKYLHKGSSVYVEGRLRTRDYVDKSGVKKYITEIQSDRLVYLDSREPGAERQLQTPEQPPQHREVSDDEMF
jgi:single-strand DNA-binding protein